MKAKLKLKPVTTKQAAAHAPVATASRPMDLFGRRWCAGESIRKLATEAGLPWTELQANLRAAGYLRSHRSVVVPNAKEVRQ